jgi:hypothetical protein
MRQRFRAEFAAEVKPPTEGFTSVHPEMPETTAPRRDTIFLGLPK